MKIEARIDRILEGALDGRPPSRIECIELLSCPETSLEASAIMAVGDAVSRRRFENRAVLLGQIGIDTAPCPGNCKFCSFGKDHTAFPSARLSMDEILGRASGFTQGGDLYALFLMTMHEFELDRLLDVVGTVRRHIPAHTQIVVNVGDFDAAAAQRLKQAGANGAYHVCRLREGQDTALDPNARKKTLGVIKDAGLDLYYCCEPIGPEHSPDELVEQLFVGIEFGCLQHAAMRRVAVPGVPLAENGQITERRLAQVTAVVALAALACSETRNIAVHEPNLLGLTAGANVVYAETGANPRDTEEDTAAGRGLDVADCRRMLWEAGFAELCRGDGSHVRLADRGMPPTPAQAAPRPRA